MKKILLLILLFNTISLASSEKGQISPLNGIDIWWQTHGDPKNPAVLLIMGLNSNSKVWSQDLIQNLQNEDLYVIVYDNRDIGKSTWVTKEPLLISFIKILPTFVIEAFVNSIFGFIFDEEGRFNMEATPAEYNLNDMALDGLSLLDHLDVKEAHVVGASMGGMITQLLALDYPERTLTITPIMSSPGMGDPELSNMTPALVKGIQESAFLDAKGNHADSVTRIYRELTGSRFPFDEEKFKEKLVPVMAHGHNPNCKHGDAAGASPSRKHRLNQISKPTLVIHGTEDAILGLDHGMALYENIPNAKKLIMEGVGHEIPEELADEITSTIIDHLKDSRSIA